MESNYLWQFVVHLEDLYFGRGLLYVLFVYLYDSVCAMYMLMAYSDVSKMIEFYDWLHFLQLYPTPEIFSTPHNIWYAFSIPTTRYSTIQIVYFVSIDYSI